MTDFARTALLAGVLFGLPACGDGDAAPGGAATVAESPAAAAGSGQQDLATVAEYRLTMANYDKYLAAQRNIAQKFQAMSPAEREALEAQNENASDESIDDMVRNIERVAPMNQAIREAGLSAREYALFTFAMMQSAMAAGVAKMRPNDNQDSLIREMEANPDNVRWIHENEAEINRKQTEIAAEMERMGVTEQDDGS